MVHISKTLKIEGTPAENPSQNFKIGDRSIMMSKSLDNIMGFLPVILMGVYPCYCYCLRWISPSLVKPKLCYTMRQDINL
jgi:hypothetical protein